VAKSFRSIFRNIFPWLIAGVIFYYLFSKYSVTDVLASIQYVNPAAFVFFVLVYFSYMVVADSGSLHFIFAQFDIQIPWIKILHLRMASYLLMVVNYGIGQGLFAYFLKRKHDVPFAKSTSILLCTVVIDLYWAMSIAFVASLFSVTIVKGINLSLWIQGAWVVLTSIMAAFVLFWRLPLKVREIPWLKVRQFFQTFHEAHLTKYLKIMLMRLPLHCATMTYLYFLAACFGVHIPFIKILTLVPISVAIGAIPITPSGLGTIQVVSILLFQNLVSGGPLEHGDISPPALILSMTLMFTLSIHFLKLLSGAFFFRFVKE